MLPVFFPHISELKNKNAPRPTLKFRFDKQSHSATVSLSTWESLHNFDWTLADCYFALCHLTGVLTLW